jgi:hypothetical protein
MMLISLKRSYLFGVSSGIIYYELSQGNCTMYSYIDILSVMDMRSLKFPHFLKNRFTDGGENISLTQQPPFILRKIRSTHFY